MQNLCKHFYTLPSTWHSKALECFFHVGSTHYVSCVCFYLYPSYLSWDCQLQLQFTSIHLCSLSASSWLFIFPLSDFLKTKNFILQSFVQDQLMHVARNPHSSGSLPQDCKGYILLSQFIISFPSLERVMCQDSAASSLNQNFNFGQVSSQFYC